jgi:hypothetical protein
MQTLGEDNPIYPLETCVETLRKRVEASGIRNPEQYFGDVVKAWKARRAQVAAPPADPRLEFNREKMQARRSNARSSSASATEDHQAASDTSVKQRKLASPSASAMRLFLRRQLKLFEAHVRLQEHDPQRQGRRETPEHVRRIRADRDRRMNL